jgi:hypothetical protein
LGREANKAAAAARDEAEEEPPVDEEEDDDDEPAPAEEGRTRVPELLLLKATDPVAPAEEPTKGLRNWRG